MLRLSLVVVAVAACACLLAGSAVSASSVTPSYPVTITVTNGKVTIPKQPRRIVSLSASATESLFAIGAGGQVVAVDDQSDYPKNAPKTTLSGFTPNVEAIAGYKPDLVIASYDPKGMSVGLQKLGIRVVIQDAPKTLAGAYQQIRQLGLATGHLQQATTTINGMKARIAHDRREDEGSGRGLVGVPRAHARLLLRVLELVHREDLRDARSQEHRRCGRLAPAPATHSSRPSTSSRRART